MATKGVTAADFGKTASSQKFFRTREDGESATATATGSGATPAAAAFLALEEEEERRPPHHIRLDGTTHQRQVRKRAKASGRQLVTGQEASNRASRAFSSNRDQASSGGAVLRDVRGCLVMLSIYRRSVGGLISGGGVAEERRQQSFEARSLKQ